jgi:hypothetical protein
MSIFRLPGRMRIPHSGNAAFVTAERGRIFIEKLGIGLETCIVFSHVQNFGLLYRAMGDVA